MISKRLCLTLIFCCLITFEGFSKRKWRDFFVKADKFFKQYVQDGEVKYASIRINPKSLNALVRVVENTNVESESVTVRQAYYINAYNLLVIKNIIDHYPIPFPVETIGIFSGVKFKVGKDSLTLNELEERIVSINYEDPRSLFALNPGTKGFPGLRSFAYTPSHLEKQLEEQMKLVSNDESYVRVFVKDSLILLGESFRCAGSIYSPEDWVVLINKYRQKPLPFTYRIDFYPVNRRLNIFSGELETN